MLVFVLFAFVFIIYSSDINETIPNVDESFHFYIENGYADTYAKNIVTSIYLEYRVFDTLFETLLLFISATAIVHNLNKDELVDEANNRHR